MVEGQAMVQGSGGSDTLQMLLSELTSLFRGRDVGNAPSLQEGV